MPADLLSNAIERRIANHRRNMVFYAILGTAVAIVGGGVLLLLWHWMRLDTSEVIKQVATAGASMITAGAGGFFFKQALVYRHSVTSGTEWMAIYDEARCPPPHDLLSTIEDKVLDWLERTND